jgi:large subunit ribosomal protein L13
MFAYNADNGDHVIVINADKALLTGNKADELVYWHSGYPGGIKSISRGKLLEKDSEKLIRRAIWGMLPKHRLGRQIIKKLSIYKGAEHPHAGQNPATLEVR